MKKALTRLFWPILRIFETGEKTDHYKTSHRVVLNVVGSLFVFLSLVSAVSALFSGATEGLIPVLIFFCAGSVSLIVGTLGSDSAVSKIWGSNK